MEYKGEPCGRANCAPCRTKPGKCKTAGITYRITCEDCKRNGIKSTYIGESNRTFFDRAKEHVNALKNKDAKYGIVKHWMEQHRDKDDPPEFSFNQIRTHKSAIDRQIWEALLIEREKCSLTMNSKAEWGRNRIPRLVNDPEEFIEAGISPKDNHKTHTKRTADGFKVNPNTRGNLQPTSATQSAKVPIVQASNTFESQYKQRKRQRVLQSKMQAYEAGESQINSQISQDCLGQPKEPHKGENLSKGDEKAKPSMCIQNEGINTKLWMDKWVRSGKKTKDQ